MLYNWVCIYNFCPLLFNNFYIMEVRKTINTLCLPFFATIGIIGCDGKKDIEKPNIILIMADDMGYSDIGCYGGEVFTPNIDKLAENGIRFTQFYNNARSCPTRAALLTGLYPHQTGIGYMVDGGSKYEAYKGDLNNKCLTIAEVLKENGYSTYMSGKWHVSKSVATNDKHNWPIQRGFQKFYGTITGAGSYYDPATLTYNNDSISAPDSGYYYTNAISDSTISFLDKHFSDNSEKPFFFYVSFTSPHWPLHAPKNDINKYKEVFSEGWDKLREKRYKRMIDMGIISSNWKLSERDPSSSAWENIEKKKWEEQRMMTYAAQIDIMDQGIGRIISKLQEEGKLDNTLIIFLADNGGCAETFDYGTKWVRRYGPEKTKTNKEVFFGNDNELFAGGENTYMSYGLPWANLSNTPFRYYKHYAYEGGVSTPFIVHCPNMIKAGGEFRNTLSSIIDIMPTLIEVTGAIYPTRYNGINITHLEGISLVPLFKNKEVDRDEWFMEHGGNRAYRKGDWKIVGLGNSQNWELYNIVQDRTETNNLNEKYPDRVIDMKKTWNEWAYRVGVLPNK